VALLFERAPRVQSDPDGPVVTYSLPAGRGRARAVRTSYDELVRVLQPGVEARVVLARSDVPASVMAALSRALGYKHEIEGQHAGHWFGPSDRVPDFRPAYLPSAAVVTPRTSSDLVGQPLLVVAPIDSEWRPLLATASVAYTFGEGLERGERWRFAPTDEPWPTLYVAQIADPIDGLAAGRLFPAAVSRLRNDSATQYLRIILAREA
jgi:hypothetical protein